MAREDSASDLEYSDAMRTWIDGCYLNVTLLSVPLLTQQ